MGTYLKQQLEKIQAKPTLPIYLGENTHGMVYMKVAGGKSILGANWPNATIVEVGEDHIVFRVIHKGGQFNCFKIVPFARMSIEIYVEDGLD